MPKALKLKHGWATNIDMPCNGVGCRTPKKKLPHKHRKRLVFRTREEADFKSLELQKVRSQLRHGIIKGQMAWGTFKNHFLIYSRGKNTQTHYRDKLAIRYLELHYPISTISQITPELLTSLKQRLLDSGKKAWNVNRVLSALKAMMRFAEASKFIDAQAWRLTRMIPTPKGRLEFWKSDEIRALYSVCRGIWETIARLSIEAGLRREEIHTLKIENIDFVRNRIHIVGDENWIPKGHERRWVPMKLSTAKHLKKLCNGSGYILGEDRPNLDVMTNYFRALVKKAKQTGSLHKGRHTYGSNLAMLGIPLSVIQKRMGHASIRTTEIYSHLCPDKMQELYAA